MYCCQNKGTSGSTSTSQGPARPGPAPTFCPCTYPARPSPRRTALSEYCSNAEPTINHSALSPRRAPRLALCPPSARPRLARRGSSAGLCVRDTGAVVKPASFLGAGDWGRGALLELSIMLFLVRLAFGAARCDARSAERRGALHTNRDARERAN